MNIKEVIASKMNPAKIVSFAKWLISSKDEKTLKRRLEHETKETAKEVKI